MIMILVIVVCASVSLSLICTALGISTFCAFNFKKVQTYLAIQAHFIAFYYVVDTCIV